MDIAFESGLGSLSFGRVGARLGIADRTVVYYFPTKDDLVTAVVVGVGLLLQASLEEVLPEPAADHRELLRLLWAVLRRPETDRVAALYFEAVGMASAGRRPYTELVPALVTAWIDWAESRIDAPPGEARLEAEAAIALADGLMLMRRLAGGEAADRAALRLGFLDAV
jgi:AcrR family transcriptional regulator